jgi:uncharacterized YigZ family protein
MSHTLAAAAAHAIEVRHSHFRAQAIHVAAAEDALAWLAAVAERDATHNCWAYRIGEAYRWSDDGEPAGTAGRPILAAIDGQGYDQVVVVVTRWFGGIKLGAGGLVRAYGGAAAECLRTAARRPIVALRTLRLQCGFDDIGNVHAALAAFDACKLHEAYDAQGVTLRLSVPEDRADALLDHLRDATRDRVRIMPSPDQDPR